MKIKLVTRAMEAILVVGVARLLATHANTDALTGADVVNNSGESIGKIKEFVADPQAKGKQFAVVESGGTYAYWGITRQTESSPDEPDSSSEDMP